MKLFYQVGPLPKKFSKAYGTVKFNQGESNQMESKVHCKMLGWQTTKKPLNIIKSRRDQRYIAYVDVSILFLAMEDNKCWIVKFENSEPLQKTWGIRGRFIFLKLLNKIIMAIKMWQISNTEFLKANISRQRRARQSSFPRPETSFWLDKSLWNNTYYFLSL